MNEPSATSKKARSRTRLWLLVLSSCLAVPVAIAFSESRAVLIGALIGLCLRELHHSRALASGPVERPDSDKFEP